MENLLGGILLASPISGSREMISQINQYLWYAVMIALVVAIIIELATIKNSCQSN